MINAIGTMKAAIRTLLPALLATLAGCAYTGAPQTAIEAARVQWSRRGAADAYQCPATATQISTQQFQITCGERTTQVYCTSAGGDACCTALTGGSLWQSVPGDNPIVCASRRY